MDFNIPESFLRKITDKDLYELENDEFQYIKIKYLMLSICGLQNCSRELLRIPNQLLFTALKESGFKNVTEESVFNQIENLNKQHTLDFGEIQKIELYYVYQNRKQKTR